MNEKLKGGLFVFIGACSFGLLSTIVKTAYGEGYDLGQITGSQTFFGASILWLIYLGQRVISSQKRSIVDNGKTTTPSTPFWKIMIAGTFTGLVGLFYYQCVKLIPASIAIILLMQYLWISIVIEWTVFKKNPHRMQIIAAATVLIGTILAGGIFNQSIQLNPLGIIWGLLAALSYSIFLMVSGRVGNDLPVLKKSALMITGSMIMTWIIFPPLFFFDGVSFSGLYQWGLVLALLGTVIPPLFFSIGVPKIGVSIGAILSAAELPVAVTVSHFVLKEEVQFIQWLGVILILSAIALINLKSKNRI